MSLNPSSSQSKVGTSTNNSTSASNVVAEFGVRICNHPDKRYSLLRFHAANKIDFSKVKDTRMQRENNLRQYKTAHDIVDMPTEGAGSEYGREQREEARRKKLGYSRRVYNPQDQPWLLSVGKGKEERRFKGTQEGGISENVAYFAFVQSSDGGFLAYPISEWYNMTPEINYRYLKEDEAEEEFNRRHKRYNLFNVMVKKRMNDAQEEELADNEGDGGDMPDFSKRTKKKAATKKKGRSFKLTDMDDWLGSSDEADEDSDAADKEADKNSDVESKSKKAGKKRKQKTKDDVESEGFEDSDLDDHDGDEVDYMTHSSSDEEKLSADEREKLYKEEGVDQEVALKALLTDISSDAEEEGKNTDSEEKKDEEKTKSSKVQSQADSSNSSDNEDSSSTSAEDSDSEIDKKAASAVAYQRRLSASLDNHIHSPAAAQSSTNDVQKSAPSRKRPFPDGDRSESLIKKHASSSSLPLGSKLTGLDNSVMAQVESEVRKYLLRKPISAQDLLKKIRMKKLVPKDCETSHVLGNVLKKLNPQKIKVQGAQKLHLKG